MYKVGAAIAAIAISGCGPVMEASRPDPVDLHQFSAGQSRTSVLAELGPPLASSTDEGQNCDIYKLYTHGPGAVGKGVIAAGEAVADVFTLGLAEVIFTPTEAATRNSKHTVLACYSPEKRLQSLKESDAHIDD